MSQHVGAKKQKTLTTIQQQRRWQARQTKWNCLDLHPRAMESPRSRWTLPPKRQQHKPWPRVNPASPQKKRPRRRKTRVRKTHVCKPLRLSKKVRRNGATRHEPQWPYAYRDRKIQRNRRTDTKFTLALTRQRQCPPTPSLDIPYLTCNCNQAGKSGARG